MGKARIFSSERLNILMTRGNLCEFPTLSKVIRPVVRRATLASPLIAVALAIGAACSEPQPVEVERVVEVVKEVEVPVEVEVVKEVEVPVEVEVVKEVEVPVEVEVVKEVEVPVEVEVVKEVEVPVEVEVVREVEVPVEVEVVKEVEVERVVEVVRAVEVVREIEVPVEVEVVREVEVPVEVEVVKEVEVVREVEVIRHIGPTDLLPPGLWAADLVADPGQTTSSPPWFAIRITPGEDPYRDPWRLSGGPLGTPGSLCDLRYRSDGWELSSCEGITLEGLRIFAPIDGGEVEVTISSPTFVARGVLTRIEASEEPTASENVEVLWHQPGEYIHSDIWADDGLVFAPRYDGAIEIIGADHGDLVGSVSGLSVVFDVKARGGILYAATLFGGLQIYDISDPARPRHIGEFLTRGRLTNFHNIFLSPDGSLVYAINNSYYPETDLIAIDVSNPSRPVHAGRFRIESDKATAFNFHDTHDLNVIEVEGRLIAFLNYLAAGLWILDVTDPRDITVISSINWEGIFSHSGWPFWIDGKLYYAHNSEGYDSHMTILDVSDLADPKVISRFATRKGVSIHNVEVVEGIAYIAYYLDGLRVVDLRDPERPREIGHFDTVPDGHERDILQGAWGVRVLDGTVYVSDIERGVYAFRVRVD